MPFKYTNVVQTDYTNPSLPTSGVNPEVIVTNTDLVIQPSPWPRTVYTRRQYSPLAMFSHTNESPAEGDYFLGGEGKYDDTIFFYPMKSQIASAGGMPSFLTKETYSTGYSKMNTGFLTPQKSIMPKVLVPSQKIVDNGISGTIYEGVMNWDVGGLESVSTTTEDAQKMIILRSNEYEGFVWDALLLPDDVIVSGLEDVDSSKFIGGGAFQIVVCFFDIDLTGSESLIEGGGYSNGYIDDKIQPHVQFEMGDLKVMIESDGKCTGSWKSGEKNSCTINLISGSGEECIPQAKLASEGSKVYVLSVYPCWNGVVIQSGIQNAENLASSSAAFIPKYKRASIFDFVDKIRIWYQEVVFSPYNPKPLIVKTISNDGTMNSKPDLGDDSSVFSFTASNCECKVAYAPLFFHKSLSFDHVIRGSITTDDFNYTYTAYPIWTSNGTTYSLQSTGGIEFEDTGEAGGLEFTHLFKIQNILSAEDELIYQRVAGEMFGCIVAMTETRNAEPVNTSGNYNNGITGWENYITNVTLSNTLDSSGGSITFDKFGATLDQDSSLQQSVGGIQIQAKGTYNTNGASVSDADKLYTLFKGYTWTANENKTSSGADVTITLLGVEKRLEDYHLINPPIFDGYSFGEVVAYICGNAGVAYDLTSANASIPLMISTDINVALYNWTTGMDAKSALDQVCQDTAHRYTPIDGVLCFYQLDNLGVPIWEGTSWNAFENTRIQTIDTRPDFDNIRNQVVLIAMRKSNLGRGKAFPDDFPVFPITSLISNDTDPVIPWQKAICYTLPGFLEEMELEWIGENIARTSRKYELLGTTTIPGANIKPLDIFMDDFVVTEVTQNIDLSQKTWTTSLGFMRK